MGIYGFLSAAYQKTAALDSTVGAQIALIETKRDNIEGQLAVSIMGKKYLLMSP